MNLEALWCEKALTIACNGLKTAVGRFRIIARYEGFVPVSRYVLPVRGGFKPLTHRVRPLLCENALHREAFS